MKIRKMEILGMILLGIGFLIMGGTIGNIEYADLTHTVGISTAEMWIRIVISVVLMVAGTAIGNRANR